jgi:hypothetical protein
VSKQLTQSAKKLIAEEPEAASVTGSRSPFGARPEITALMNESKFTPLLKSLIGDFDAPITTHMGILPVATAPPGPLDMPYFNAGVHMDGLTTTSPVRKDGTFEEKYCEFINASPDARSHAALHQPGRHHLNIGTNGGMLFQDKDCSLSTGSFTLFAVLCLNDQTAPGHGQFCVLRGCHHAMEAFYQSQIDAGGIIGPEGPGWPRMGPMVPEAVRDHFIDEASLPAPAYDGKLFPRPTQCLMEEGDVTITMHAIPHSGTRNEGEEPRMNVIWRIRGKMRQPNFVCDGATDHPDRWSRADPRAPINGDYNMELFEQDEPPYYPGEQGNDPFERSKFALSHIWHGESAVPPPPLLPFVSVCLLFHPIVCVETPWGLMEAPVAKYRVAWDGRDCGRDEGQGGAERCLSERCRTTFC